MEKQQQSIKQSGCGCIYCKKPHPVCVGYKHAPGPCDCVRVGFNPDRKWDSAWNY